MTVRVPSNAVTRRVAKLSNQWRDFAEDERARLLCWKFASDEQRMADAFFALELDERTAEHSELFLTLEHAFAAATTHGRALREELVEQYRADQEGLRAEGLDAEWQAPEALNKEGDQALLVRTCSSFADYHKLPGHLVLVLRPKSVSSAAAYQKWLLELSSIAPEGLRVIALDTPSSPVPPGLLEERSERVMVRKAELSMPDAYAEVSANAGNGDTPGNRYRELFLQLGAALGSNDLDGALRLGAAALAIANAEQWFHLTVPVHAALGHSLGAQDRTDEAREQYVTAEKSALRGVSEGPLEARDACKKLRLQSRLGLGAALMAGKEHKAAAEVFAATIPLAAESGEDGMRLECYRLAALCHELDESPTEAFRWAYDGLSEAKHMPAETLAVSGLPYLGDSLLRSCEPAGRESLRAEIERDLEALTGKPDWRPALPSKSEPDAA